MTRIAVAIKDAGSYNAVMPVVLFLKEAHPDWEFEFYAASVTATRLERDSIEFYTDPDKFDPTRYNLVICGTSRLTDGNFLESIITQKAIEKQVPTIWVSDVWLSSCRLEHMDVQPSLITSIDEACTALIRQLRPTANVVTTGNPNFDQWVKIDYTALRKEGREKIGLTETQKLVYFVGGYFNQSAEVLDLLCQSLQLLGVPENNLIKLAVRLHPKVMSDPTAAEDKEKFSTILQKYPWLIRVDDLPSAEWLLPACDLVVANWTTVHEIGLYMTGAFGGPLGLHILLDADRRQLSKESFRGLLDTMPSVKLGAATAIYQDDCRKIAGRIVELLYQPQAGLIESCRRNYATRNSATQRVAEQVCQLING